MLRLLNIIPCQRVIIDKTSQTVSVIDLLENIQLETPKNSPDKFLFPFKWSLLVLWRRTESLKDSDKLLQQVVVSDGFGNEVYKTSNEIIILPNIQIYRGILEFREIPVAEVPMTMEIKVYLSKEREAVTEVGSYPLFITRKYTENNLAPKLGQVQKSEIEKVTSEK